MRSVSETPWVVAYIALGSNVGNRVGFLQGAIRHLRRPDFITTKISSFYETEPVGFTAQEPFLNGVLEGKTILSPKALFETLQKIERDVGRIQRKRWGPREIDLDLLFYGEEVIEEPSFSIPHPRLHERDFVLLPLSELCPDFKHPKLKKTVRELLTECHLFDASHPKPYPVEVRSGAV